MKIPAKDVTHIEDMKDYVRIYLSTLNRPVLAKSTLKGIEESLPKQGFMRVHKSYIINLDKIESVRRNRITIKDYEIPVSGANLEKLMQALNCSK